MAGGERAPEQEQRQRSLTDLPEEILSEILLPLPPKSILRCRAVCKIFRRLTSDRAFLLAHHRHRPARRLLSFVRDIGVGYELGVLDYCVEALDLRTREFHSVVRFTGDHYCSMTDEMPFVLHAVCDGLLLMSYHDILYISNPATHQSAYVFLPALPVVMVLGLYAHGTPGEYRVLHCRRYDSQANVFFSTAVDSKNQKRILSELSAKSMKKWLPRGSQAGGIEGPTISHGHLHWLPQPDLCQERNILVFDTTNELFELLLAPVIIEDSASLLEIHGMLAMSNSYMGGSKVDLWLLEDYKRAVWVCKYHIELPVIDFPRFEEDDNYWCSQVVSEEGEVLVEGFETNNWHFLYDKKGNFRKKFHCDGRLLNFTTHILRESLVPHAFFQMQKKGGTHEPPFFFGL